MWGRRRGNTLYAVKLCSLIVAEFHGHVAILAHSFGNVTKRFGLELLSLSLYGY